MSITGFDHYTIRARDVEVSAAFYTRVMGMEARRLDSFSFPFVMLYSGEHAVVHLLGVGAALDEFLARPAPSYGAGPERRTGNLEHVAFNATDHDDLVARLNQVGVVYTARTLTQYGVRQLLFEDPDGIEIEVNFPLAAD